MVAQRPFGRIRVLGGAVGLLVVVAVAGVLTSVSGHAASQPILQVSPEVGTATDPHGGPSDKAELTATVTGEPAGTGVNFHVVDGVASGSPDQSCTIDGSGRCSVDIKSEEAGTSLVRAWIATTVPDLGEGRLADANPTPPWGVPDSTADCQRDDSPDASMLGGTDDLCHQAIDPGTGKPDVPTPGDVPEPDGTDVVRVTWTAFSVGRLDCRSSNGTHVQYNNAATKRTETYRCELTTTKGAPIPGAFIDGEILSGPDAKSGRSTSPGTADLNDLCETGSDGRCTKPFDITMATNGADTICFWAQPAKPKNHPNDRDVGNDDTYDPGGSNTNGGGCRSTRVDHPGGNNVTSVVYLDTDLPRAEGLDETPKVTVSSRPTRFSLQATVYDQFSQPFRGTTEIKAKLFPGSVLADEYPPADLAATLTCTTRASATCTMVTPAQNDLGTNLACAWIDPGKAPRAMVGEADQASAVCTAQEAPWQSTPDQKSPPDAGTHENGPPSPATDGIDVVRFTLQSHPTIVAVTPNERRQDTTGDVLAVDGGGFLAGADITISGTGVSLGPTYVASDTHLEASLEVAPDAPPGARDVTVTNGSDGGTTTCAACFHVIGQGLWLVASDGVIFAIGDAPFEGSIGESRNKPVVGMASAASGDGYWVVASDGGIFAFGDALFLGSAGDLHLIKPIVGMAATPSDRGYWLVASDGGVFGFGDARFFGGTSHLSLAKPIVGMAATPSGRGYWLVASDGGVFGFGDARFFGATGGVTLNQPITAMSVTRTGRGYWLTASDGGIFAFGDATFYGSAGSVHLNQPIVAMDDSPSGKGYWLVAADGGIFSFGDARFLGPPGAVKPSQPIVGAARR